ncbi:ATP-binding protein [Natronorubrum sp. FCH18a]|uniref:ATP-binding protein n=1 Tax=Natronorubrum sp. FCH18a TaxID=3447018 RepID=UPI003F50EED6
MSQHDSNSESANGRPIAKVHPSKKTYSSIAADVTVDSALAELIDNSIDSAAILDKDPVNVTISYDNDAEEMVYSDHAGGVKPDEMGVFLGLGRSKDMRAEGRNIGAFGMGTKKALNHLANSFTIASRHEDVDQGWKYTVDDDFFAEDNETWEFEMEPADLDPGQTVLTLHDLTFDWHEIEGDVRDQLEQKYQRFLSDEYDTSATLSVDLTGEELTPPPQVQWTFSPWQDGSHPRRFTGLEFTDDQWSAPIEVEVTVGLMRQSNIEKVKPGTAFFCQDRLVEQGLTGPKGGFGQFGMNKFNNAKDKRLRIEIDFYTEGNADDLPWNSDKSRISRMHSALSSEHGVYYWLRRFADRHKKIGMYGDAPKWIFTEYDSESLHAANDGEIEGVNVADKQQRLETGDISQPRIHNKPDKNLSLAKDLERVAIAHSELGIRSERIEWFKSWVVPAYEEAIYDKFTDRFDTDDEHLPHLLDVDSLDELLNEDGFDRAEIIAGLYEADDAPDGQTHPWDSEENIKGVLDDIESDAESDVESGQRRSADAYDDVRVHRYEYELARACTDANVEIDDLDLIDDDPTPLADENEPDESATEDSEARSSNHTSSDGLASGNEPEPSDTRTVDARTDDGASHDGLASGDEPESPDTNASEEGAAEGSSESSSGGSYSMDETAYTDSGPSSDSADTKSQASTDTTQSEIPKGPETDAAVDDADDSRDTTNEALVRDPDAAAVTEQLEDLKREHNELLDRLDIDEDADPKEWIDQLVDAAEQLQTVLDLLEDSPVEGDSLEERLETLIDQANRYEKMMQAASE